MSYAALLQQSATQAQSILAQMGGMAPTAAGNFIGPDGRPYTLVFRAADAFETESVAREMTLHGYTDRSVMIATATRTQFTAAPLGWRRQNATRLYPAPAAECLIASIATDDPLVYSLFLLFRQPQAVGN